MESENIGLDLILTFNSWTSLSKLLYPSGPQFAKFLKIIITGQGSNEIMWMKEL